MTRDIFEITMDGLEAGLRVRDIATFDLRSCETSDPEQDVFARSELSGFDYVPVRRGGSIVGVLNRGAEPSDRPAGEVMQPLDESILVAAEEPLTRFILEMPATPYRLVVGETIVGIVTRSDVHKLPVRLLAFALVTHLEMTMARAIDLRAPDDGWLEKLRPPRRERVEEKLAARRDEQIDPPLLELTEFCDKRDVLARLGALGGGKQRESAVRDLKHVEGLRNEVAHAANFGPSEQALVEFVRRLQVTRHWIAELSGANASEVGVNATPSSRT